MSYRKSPQFLGSILSVLANLNNTEVWMVLIRPLIYKFTISSTIPFMTVLSECANHNFMSHRFSRSLHALFQFYEVVSRNGKMHSSAGADFFVDYHLTVISLHLKTPMNFIRLIFQDGF